MRMKAHENTVDHAADSDDNLNKKIELGAALPSSCFHPDKDGKLPATAGWDANTATIPLAPVIIEMEVYSNNVSDDFQDEDAPKENLF